MKRLSQLLIGAVLFLIPSNLFYVLTETGARVHGLRVDYLLPKFYLSDLVIWALICVYLFQHSDHLKKDLVKLWKERRTLALAIFILTMLLIVRQFFVTSPLIAIWTTLGWIKVALLAYVLWQKRAVLSSAGIYITLAGTVLFQSLLAYWQWFTQTSFARYWFLGETDLSAYAGLAKTTIGNIDRVLPYGTTAHPNVLGGFLVVGILVLLNGFKKLKSASHKIFVSICICASIVALVLTQSVSAILALLLGTLVVVFPKKQYSLLVAGSSVMVVVLLGLTTWFPITSDNPSITRRSYLNRSAVHMMLDQPLLGVGLQNFTHHVENYSPEREVVRFVQPAHSVPLLFLAETGLLGLLLAGTTCNVLYKKKHLVYFLPLIPLLFLDHYLLTLQTGLLMGIFFWVYFRAAQQT